MFGENTNQNAVPLPQKGRHVSRNINTLRRFSAAGTDRKVGLGRKNTPTPVGSQGLLPISSNFQCENLGSNVSQQHKAVPQSESQGFQPPVPQADPENFSSSTDIQGVPFGGNYDPVRDFHENNLSLGYTSNGVTTSTNYGHGGNDLDSDPDSNLLSMHESNSEGSIANGMYSSANSDISTSDSDLTSSDSDSEDEEAHTNTGGGMVRGSFKLGQFDPDPMSTAPDFRTPGQQLSNGSATWSQFQRQPSFQFNGPNLNSVGDGTANSNGNSNAHVGPGEVQYREGNHRQSPPTLQANSGPLQTNGASNESMSHHAYSQSAPPHAPSQWMPPSRTGVCAAESSGHGMNTQPLSADASDVDTKKNDKKGRKNAGCFSGISLCEIDCLNTWEVTLKVVLSCS